MIRLLRKLLNYLDPPKINYELYVVVYDVAIEGGKAYSEEYYGYFATPEEAHQLFYDAFPPHGVCNVKLCRIVEEWPGAHIP